MNEKKRDLEEDAADRVVVAVQLATDLGPGCVTYCYLTARSLAREPECVLNTELKSQVGAAMRASDPNGSGAPVLDWTAKAVGADGKLDKVKNGGIHDVLKYMTTGLAPAA